ncbi:uncharacterized protein BT62DRAFT_263279 [Guyanagaster necrorhizus]|uniref:RRM domain-containing protein n=1 Tax=Guyanagaster necrorhizus TaxID=856835 RepID=A0A9P7W3H0_9AGAR|nr:uncharacterized protein BT62DRAFT_263279 [Guyanagaster necrorhizus MCA 3950]KAG7451735.1 hypothetical protein BT62DRAFT_263279 [Guyanagaster necrorhizus MCA 3950]
MNMLRLSFSLRRLRRPHTPYASYATAAAESPSLRRTVRVENLPEGYNVSDIVDTVKANPAEAIIPAKDHLLVRFFDEGTARCCVEANKELSLKIDDSTSPALDTQTVALLAKYNASRTLRLLKLPESFTESQFNEILSSCGGVSSGLDRSEGGLTEVQFLDVHQADKARIEFAKAGTAPRYIEAEHLSYPEWYSKDDTQPNQERLVKIEGIADPQTLQMCIDWTDNYNEIAPASFITARFVNQKQILVYFATSTLARQFISICEPLAQEKCTMSLQTSDRTVAPGVLTALGVGARRIIAFPFTKDLPEERRLALGRFLYRFGGLHLKGVMHTEGQLIIPFATVVGAANLVYPMYRYPKGMKLPAELDGLQPTFVGTRHS